MVGVAFLVGILAGLVGEWLVDIFYWRKKRVAWAEKEAGLRADLLTAQTEIESARAELGSAQAETDALRADVANVRDEANSLRSELATSEDRALKLAMAEVPQDDLTIIEGIGPKTADLLDGHDIRTFAVLAETSVERLRAILHEGGPGFRLSDPTTWPRQARLAANRQWTRLQQLKQQLTGGVRKPSEPEPVPRDDLTIVEGIGDKIAELLNQNGIYTFAQLAETTEDQLRAILQAAGPSFQLADPHTWPRQAQLAADRDWEGLQQLKQKLTGGVRKRATRKPPEPEPIAKDDLTIVEGIGEKIAELLNQNGIHTFAQLGDASEEQLRGILEAAGPSFQLADPHTWPRQARLAANRDWERLQQVKQGLTGGVRRPATAVPAPQNADDVGMTASGENEPA
jgi:predicted flap endonuclease-1-like 5' DNA nuclease